MKDLSKGSYRLIICSGAYDAISRQLREMGIGDFRIYVRLIDELIETKVRRKSRAENTISVM